MDSSRTTPAVALNWAIVGTDAHPRNYSVLIREGGDVQLAPLYDIASGIFLPAGARRKVAPEARQLAMAVGGAVTVENVTRASWEAEARAAGLRPERVIANVTETVEAIISAADAVARRGVEAGTPSQFAERFRDGVVYQARQRLSSLG